MHNYLDYRSGAVLIMNGHIETDVVNTEGKSYGVEVMVKKPRGKLNGWFSYTYSSIMLRQDDPVQATQINRGEWYLASYDKPHEFKLVRELKIYQTMERVVELRVQHRPADYHSDREIRIQRGGAVFRPELLPHSELFPTRLFCQYQAGSVTSRTTRSI